MKTNTPFTLILIAMLSFGLSACSDKHQDVHADGDVHHEDVHHEDDHQEDVHHKDSHGDDDHQEAEAEAPHEDLDVVLEEKALEMIGLTLDVVKERTLYKDVQLSGQIVENNDRLQKVYPRFSGMVKEVFACMGDSVREGQTLATIQNNETLTEYALISALDGIVTKKHVTVGEIIKEDTHIMTIADLKDVWVEFDVHTKDIEHVKKGQIVTVSALGLSSEVQGVITYISPVMDSEKRSLTARVVLSNTSGVWAPGIFVKGVLHIETEVSGPAVPNHAIQIVENKKAIFVPEDEHTFTTVFIEAGDYDKNYTIINSGISLNELFVSKGAFELKAKLVTSSLGGHAGHGH